MRRHMAWLGVAVLGLSTLASGSAAEVNSWGSSLFTESGINFGPVPRGAKVRHQFVLTNRLKETVSVLDVRASCGCTSGFASQTTIEPGKTAYIEAQMDTRNFVGIKATTLTVTLMTASGYQDEAKFAIQSNILSDIVLNPGSIDFGTVAKGQAPKLLLTIERAGSPNWRAVKMVSTSKVLNASLQETSRSAAGVVYFLAVAIKRNAGAGSIRDEVRIITNDQSSPVVPVLVTGMIQGSLTATPALLALGNVAPAGAQGRYIVRASKPFSIKSIEGAGDGFTLSAADQTAKTMHVLTMNYRPDQGSTRGDLRRTFKVTTDLPDESPIELNASLHVNP
jgi:hypothetical protein